MATSGTATWTLQVDEIIDEGVILACDPDNINRIMISKEYIFNRSGPGIRGVQY